MEKTTRKPVDRQATFDTDPHRAHLTKGNLKLPVIEAQDKYTGKPETKENSQTNKAGEQKKKTSVTNSKNEVTEKAPKAVESSVKASDSNIKSNILSNINKKVANNTEKESKEIGISKGNPKKTSDSTVKNTNDNNNSSVIKNDKSKVVPTEQKVVDSTRTTTLAKSTSQKLNHTKNSHKGNEAKTVDTHKTGNSKSETIQKHGGNTNKLTHLANKSPNEPESKSNVTTRSRSRSPEKQQTSKAAVLKDLNNKSSGSQGKGKNTSPRKETKSSVEDVKITSQTSKTVASKSPHDKSLNTGDKNPKFSPRKQDSTNQGQTIKQAQGIKSPAKETDYKESQSNDSKETKIPSKNTLPTNNAPAETHLLKSEQNDKTGNNNVKISPRHKIKNGKLPFSVESSTKQSGVNHSTNEDTKLHQNEPVQDVLKQKQAFGDVLSQSNGLQNNDSKSEQQYLEQKQDKANSGSTVLKLESDSADVRKDQTRDNIRTSSNKVLNPSAQSKNETYVLSPHPTKVESKSPVGHRESRPGRLSPSNESVEPIRLEQRPSSDRTGMDLDRREPYAQVFAERNTLLNAEYTYRKRIKQLEDEANGFLKAIDELTTENRYLRSRVDSLEDESYAKGDSEAFERISELEKNKTALESKVKDLERYSKVSDTTDELRELKEQVVKIQSENQMLNEENAKLKSENNENVKKLRSLEAEKKSLETSVTGVESEKLDKIQELNKEQKKLNKQLNEIKTKNQGLEKQVDALEYENKMLSETLAQKKTELNELLGLMKDENKFDNEIKDLKNQILKLNKEKKESDLAFNKEKRILNEKLKDAKTSLENKTKDADELKIKLDQVESEHKKMKANFDPMKKLVESQKKEIARLKEEIERLQQELKERNEAYTKLENETGSASKDLKEAKEQLEQFNKDLQKIVNDKESQISKLINQIDTMREERESERKSAKEEKEKLASEMEKVETYQENTRRLEADLKHFVDKFDESKLKEKQLTLQLEDKGFEVSNLEHQLFEMNMKTENYSKRISDLDREKRDMEREKREWEVKKDKIDDIEASNKRLLEENKRLRNQIEMSSYLSTYRPTERNVNEKPVVEAWANEKNSPAINHAIYVQKEKQKDHRKKKVHLAQQSSIQKKRLGFSKSSPVKVSLQHKHEENKSSNLSTHRSLEDLRKVGDSKSPESEHSLPELKQDARSIGYGSLVGYKEIHKNRIRNAHKKIYPIY